MTFPNAPLRRRFNRLAATAAFVAPLMVAFPTLAAPSAPAETTSATSAPPPALVTAEDGAPQDNPGRALAMRWCGNCHLPPQPSDLPRDRWPYIVKWMGNYLGHPNTDDDVKKLIYPTLVATKPFITRDELRMIEEYYVSAAPE